MDEPRTVREYYRQHPERDPQAVQRWSAASFVERVRSGEDFYFALREFIDDLGWAGEVYGPEAVRALLADPPGSLGPQQDAFVAGLAEHFSVLHGAVPPAWVLDPDRFLDAWWFPARAAYDAMAFRDSPAAFRRRGVFLPPSLLQRC